MIFTGVVLLLFLLCDSTFSQDTTTPSQACIDAQMELLANRACYQAIIQVGQGGNFSMSTLQEYCSPTCRDATVTVANECVSRNI